MRKLSKQERKQLYICQERVRDVQIRMEAVREILVKKGYLVSAIHDAFSMAEQPLKNVTLLTDEIIREDDNIKV